MNSPPSRGFRDEEGLHCSGVVPIQPLLLLWCGVSDLIYPGLNLPMDQLSARGLRPPVSYKYLRILSKLISILNRIPEERATGPVCNGISVHFPPPKVRISLHSSSCRRRFSPIFVKIVRQSNCKTIDSSSSFQLNWRELALSLDDHSSRHSGSNGLELAEPISLSGGRRH